MPLEIKQNEPLSKTHDIRHRQAAKVFCRSQDKEEVLEAIIDFAEQKLPFFSVGRRSNILISDNGYDGLIIRNQIGRCILRRKITAGIGRTA